MSDKIVYSRNLLPTPRGGFWAKANLAYNSTGDVYYAHIEMFNGESITLPGVGLREENVETMKARIDRIVI